MPLILLALNDEGASTNHAYLIKAKVTVVHDVGEGESLLPSRDRAAITKALWRKRAYVESGGPVADASLSVALNAVCVAECNTTISLSVSFSSIVGTLVAVKDIELAELEVQVGSVFKVLDTPSLKMKIVFHR